MASAAGGDLPVLVDRLEFDAVSLLRKKIVEKTRHFLRVGNVYSKEGLGPGMRGVFAAKLTDHGEVLLRTYLCGLLVKGITKYLVDRFYRDYMEDELDMVVVHDTYNQVSRLYELHVELAINVFLERGAAVEVFFKKVVAMRKTGANENNATPVTFHWVREDEYGLEERFSHTVDATYDMYKEGGKRKMAVRTPPVVNRRRRRNLYAAVPPLRHRQRAGAYVSRFGN